MTTTTLDYLIPYVRLRLGDTDEDSYRYMTDWIQTALSAAILSLGDWWNVKYLLNEGGEVYRNTYVPFSFPEPPVIEYQDNSKIILVATIIILEGSLENSAWDFVSWRDAEISFSNLESSRSRNATLARLWDELKNTMKPPVKRLANSRKSSLPGYLGNEYEVGNMKI